MAVVGYVGLPGSGKTLELVARGLDARKRGRDVYANFRLGRREWGVLVEDPADPRGWRFEPRPQLREKRLRSLLEREGLRVGRGFIPDPGAHLLTSWDDLISLRVYRDDFDVPHRPGCPVVTCRGCSKGITILLDELNLWAPSRLWQELGIGVLNRWAYVRKDGLDIFWTAQHEARIDKVAREVTDFMWNCRSLGGQVHVPLLGTRRIQVFHRTKWIPALMTEKNRTAAAEGATRSGVTDFEFSFFHQKVADAYDTYEHVADSAHLREKAGASRASGRAGRASS